MRVCVGSPGTFSTRKWRSARLAICGRCVIVITCARPASRRSVSPTACAVWPPMPASISSNTIVSPPPTAAIASAMRESSPPDAVSATGPNGRPAFGRTEKTASSAPDGPGSASRTSTRNSPSPSPTPTSSAATASANLGAAFAARGRAARRADGRPRPAARERLGRRAGGIVAVGERVELGARLRGPLEQLVVGAAPVAAAQRRRSARAGSRPASSRPGSASSESRKRRRSIDDLAQRELGRAQRLARRRRARARSPRAARRRARRRRRGRRRPRARRPRAPRAPSAAASASSVTWRSRSRSARSSSSSPGLEAVRVGDERAQLVEPRLGRGRVAGQLVVGAARGGQLAPGAARRARGVGRAGERVEHRELVGRPREPALLELAAHREQRLDRRGDVLARGAPAPGVGARAAVGEDPPREDERLLALGAQLGELAERLVVGQVELRLDVGLVRRRRRSAPPRRARRAAGRSRSRGSSCPRPVSPVIAFSPGSSSSSASRMRTRFSIRSRRSIPASYDGRWTAATVRSARPGSMPWPQSRARPFGRCPHSPHPGGGASLRPQQF